MQRWKRGFAAVAALTLGTFFTSSAVVDAVAETAQAEAADDAGVVAESDDIRALVAPVALYPDPILALVLQASTLPLEVVQADRFLNKREKDPKLEPDPDWDKSIIGLLNYPRQVRLMSEYIDWTEELGNAVVDNLDAVQSAVQEIRLGAFHAGFLKSNDRQKVELKDDVVRITSTDPNKVSIPQYDPAALLTALDEVEEAEEEADEAAAPPAPAAKPAAAKQPAPPASQAAAPAAPAPQPEPAETAAAPAPAAGTVAPAVYAGEPVPPPVIAYGEPEDSFWDDAATFAGGAVVGGLLGWGLTEAFDDDDDDWWDGDGDWDSDDVQDELRERREFREERRDDVLAARDDRRADRQAGAEARRTDRQTAADVRREDRQQARADRGESREDRAARAREQLNERPEARGGRTKPAAAGSATAKAQQARAERGKRDVKLPGAGSQAGVSDKLKQRSAAKPSGQAAGKPAATKLASAKQKHAAGNAGYAPKRDRHGIAAGAGTHKQVRNEANRGAHSRVAQGGGRQPRAASASFNRGSSGSGVAAAHHGGGRGIAADHQRGSFAAGDGARGRASRGAGGGRGGGGRGRR